MHRACRVAFIHVERGEIVPVILYLRTGGDGKAQIGKNLCQLVHHLADRVHRAARHIGRRQGQIQFFAGQLRRQRRSFQCGFLRLYRIGNFRTHRLNGRGCLLAFFRAHLAQRFQRQADPAFLAQGGHALFVQRIQRCGRGNRVQRIIFLCRQFGHAANFCNSSARASVKWPVRQSGIL